MSTTMMKLVASTLALALLASCGGGSGGGSTSTGGTYYSHAQLAQEFVRRVNSDVAGYDIQLAKTNTEQYDYIVVYDRDYGSYDAYYIGKYNVGENVRNYLNTYESYFFYDLIPQSGNVYVDPYSGTRFEKQEVSSKNLAKIQSIERQLSVGKMAEKLQTQYGLSSEKSLDVASFAYKIQNSPAGTFKVQDYDAFAKELTGSTITEFQKDIVSGDSLSLNQRIQSAAEVSGMGTEGVNKLITDMFSQN